MPDISRLPAVIFAGAFVIVSSGIHPAAGHPPGDNWMVYPTPKGLVGSPRMAALQQGIQDFELLTQLRAKKPEAADRIAGKIVGVMILDYLNKNIQSEYSRDPADYLQARRHLLEELSKQP